MDLCPVRSHSGLVSVRLVESVHRFRTTRSYTLRNLRMTFDELFKHPRISTHPMICLRPPRVYLTPERQGQETHLECLKEMFARRVAFGLVHHFVWREICKLVIRLVFIIEQNPWTRVCVSPASRWGDDDVGVARVPTPCAGC